MINHALRETLLKIHALTESNNGGESKAAQRKLTQLLIKHNIKVEDLHGSKSQFFKFGYWNNVQRELLFGICIRVMKTQEIEWIKKINACEIKMTAEQYAVIDTAFNYWCKVYDREVAAFFEAFVNKHHLYNPEAETVEPEPEYATKVKGFMKNLDTVAVPGSTIGQGKAKLSHAGRA